MWHCNSTGVYSGVVANGNGDSSDTTNLDNTALRGIQRTDSDGVAQFESIFPGHYSGRATHIHVMVHTNATLYSNQTLGNDVYASHVGQAFFDQKLITEADTVSPYSSNQQSVTKNSDDSILSQEAATDNVDPFVDYVYLGNGIGDGLFAWLAFGINTSYSGHVGAAAFRYSSGGVANSDGGMGGGSSGGGGSGSGGGPGGSPPGGNGTSMGRPPTGSATPGSPAATTTTGSASSTTASSAAGAATTTSSSVSPKLSASTFAGLIWVIGLLVL